MRIAALAAIVGRNPMGKRFNWAARLHSFGYAWRGARLVLSTQHNAWIHATATVGVLGASLILGLTRLEWCLILLSCAIVWAAEAMNTALELLADALRPERHPLVGLAKDAAAGAVLIAALASALVGVLIFAPHVTRLF